MAFLELTDIGKSFDGTRVLDGVNLTLDLGESCAVVAPSGAGKSTLLSIAGLLLAPTTGKVKVSGVDTGAADDATLSRLRDEEIGFLFQNTQLLGSLRAVENVALPADFIQTKSARIPKRQAEARALCALEELGLGERAYYFPHQMSIGQKRRVACARALFLHPKLIIADEPTNDLDDKNANSVVEALFKPVQAGKAALLYATHDQKLARQATKQIKLS